jgi:hypothetical protein
MRIRTKNPVPQADKFANKDAKIIAVIRGFDLVTFTYQIEYLLETVDASGNPITKPLINFPRLVITNEEVNVIFDYLNVDLNKDGLYAENLKAALHSSLLMKVGLDSRFGLTVNDWEKL